ncbi:MAG TPA: hypothetical protein VIJ60_07575 [Acidimicrobiales bacterium]
MLQEIADKLAADDVEVLLAEVAVPDDPEQLVHDRARRQVAA